MSRVSRVVLVAFLSAGALGACDFEGDGDIEVVEVEDTELPGDAESEDPGSDGQGEGSVPPGAASDEVSVIHGFTRVADSLLGVSGEPAIVVLSVEHVFPATRVGSFAEWRNEQVRLLSSEERESLGELATSDSADASFLAALLELRRSQWQNAGVDSPLLASLRSLPRGSVRVSGEVRFRFSGGPATLVTAFARVTKVSFPDGTSVVVLDAQGAVAASTSGSTRRLETLEGDLTIADL